MSTERGSAAMAMILVVGVASVLTMILTALGGAAVQRAQLDATADLAALAAATGGARAAAAVATANRAALESCTWRDERVTVVVRRGGESSSAVAELVVGEEGHTTTAASS